jgi:hypothetical protein
MANSSWNKSSNDKVAEFVKAGHSYITKADYIYNQSWLSDFPYPGKFNNFGRWAEIRPGCKTQNKILPFIDVQPCEDNWIRSGINTTVFISSRDFIINQEQQIIWLHAEYKPTNLVLKSGKHPSNHPHNWTQSTPVEIMS